MSVTITAKLELPIQTQLGLFDFNIKAIQIDDCGQGKCVIRIDSNYEQEIAKCIRKYKPNMYLKDIRQLESYKQFVHMFVSTLLGQFMNTSKLNINTNNVHYIDIDGLGYRGLSFFIIESMKQQCIHFSEEWKSINY